MKRSIFEATFYKDATNKETISFKITIYAIDDYEAREKINKIAKITNTYWGDMKWIGKEE